MKGLRSVAAILAGTMLAGLMSQGVLAAANAGRVTQIHGRATMASPDGNIQRIRKGSGVDAGATINTSAGSFAKIKFNDGGSIFLRPSTRFRVDAFEDSGGKKKTEKSFFSLIKGGMRFVTGLIGKRNRNAYRVNTPTATIGIRGTDGALQICNNNCIAPNGLHVLVFDGAVVTTTPTGEVVSAAGKAAFVGADGTPQEADPDDSPITEDNFPSPEGDAVAADCTP